jgi:superfamily I DNA and/or RNA helicase
MLHAIKAFEIVKQILSNNNLVDEGKNRGNPARVLLQPYYRAQHRLYEIEFDKLKASGKFSENQLPRVRLHTLDSSQGDEEDIVIADLGYFFDEYSR